MFPAFSREVVARVHDQSSSINQPIFIEWLQHRELQPRGTEDAHELGGLPGSSGPCCQLPLLWTTVANIPWTPRAVSHRCSERGGVISTSQPRSLEPQRGSRKDLGPIARN